MKKVVFAFCLAFSLFRATAQVPINLLGHKADEIKTYMLSLGATTEGKKYSESGVPYYQYILDFNLEKKTNRQGTSVAVVLVQFGIEDGCTTCIYQYALKNNLEAIVDTFNKDSSFIKTPGEFSWKEIKYGFKAAIINKLEDHGFTFIYSWPTSKASN
ncbi:hypothetical protein A0256_20735 [Mucilaginibacter sp. PAMC 26640]|nr:hypothetical protein A0256_20735 [Mucilaginibacter sp. PAMC 26640]